MADLIPIANGPSRPMNRVAPSATMSNRLHSAMQDRPKAPLELQQTHLISVQLIMASHATLARVTVNVSGDYIVTSPTKARRLFIEEGQVLTLWSGWHIYEATV